MQSNLWASVGFAKWFQVILLYIAYLDALFVGVQIINCN